MAEPSVALTRSLIELVVSISDHSCLPDFGIGQNAGSILMKPLNSAESYGFDVWGRTFEAIMFSRDHRMSISLLDSTADPGIRVITAVYLDLIYAEQWFRWINNPSNRIGLFDV